MTAETEKKALAELLHAEEDRRTSFVHRLSWHEETAEAVLQALKERGWTPPPTVAAPTDTWRDTLRYAATALEGSADNGDRYCAAQIRAALHSSTLSDLNRAQRVGAIEQADAYLNTHRKTEVWSLINRLRDELVRA